MYEEKMRKVLAGLRKATGLSQSAHAKAMGTTQEYVCRMEKKGAVTLEKFSQYVAACGAEAKLVVKCGEKIHVIRLTEKKGENKA